MSSCIILGRDAQLLLATINFDRSMSRPHSSRSKAHGFSAFSTALGVALTLGVLGTLVVGTMVVRELRTDWLASMTVQIVLEEGVGGSRMAADWLGEEGVQSAVYIDADSASAEMERELGEPFMDFLGDSPLPSLIELTLDPDWIDREGVAGLAALASGWEGREGVTRVAYPRRILERLERGFSDWTTPLILLLAIFMAVAVAQIFNVVRLSVFGRRHLIRSMELVGAPPFRIRRPFIGEAMGYGAVGVLLAYSAVVALLGALEPFLSVLGQWGPTELALVLGVQLSVGLLMTGLSARWAVGRYLGASLDKLV